MLTEIFIRETLRRRRFVLHQAGFSLAGSHLIESVWEGPGGQPALPQLDQEIWDQLSAVDQRSWKALDPQIGHWLQIYQQSLSKGWKFLIFEEIQEALQGLSAQEVPSGLWCHGTLDLTNWRFPMVAIVGSRKASAYGLTVAERLAKALSREGVVVVSGLAYGIDLAAHQASLESQAPTVAVLGTGLDQNYPASHRDFQREKIPSNGLVITEFRLGDGPQAYHFPQRNRIIAALSQVVVVIEGDVASGSLITARHAARLGKDVWAVPGSIFAAGSAGPHLLIKEGAAILSKPEDLLESLPEIWARAPRPIERWTKPDQVLPNRHQVDGTTASVSSPTQEKMLKYLSGEPIGMDQLLLKSGFSLEEASRILLELEMEGRVVSGPHGYARG